MTEIYRINHDVYKAITCFSTNNFRVTDVRKYIQSHSDAYGSVSNARQFVARQLDKLEKAGLVVSQGSRHNKTYSKTRAFNEVRFDLKEKRLTGSQMSTTKCQSTPIYTALQQEKSDIEAELTITLEELKEYKILMKRSNELCRLLNEPHLNATKKAASLVAKLNVWSEALKRLRKSELIPC
ncbi:hypothetical protein F0266_11925 [Vibrio coralliilyticus]|uniref:hypothetical protein n=1 Tax=Vibrio coralliilyticus TaxID=190893 RepID=UPI00148C787E|nr:hypothetical protein [Vibrio coralliilyticus]NOH53645.1 hypothetical protein [Vibrio coralliilyticus]